MRRDIYFRLLASVVIVFLMFGLHRAITVAPRAGRPVLQSAEAVLVAQGGAASQAPANTLVAFQTALDLGADFLALDVRLSADGELIVLRDETVDRATDGAGKVSDLTLAQLKTLDAGYRFIPDGGITYPYRGKGVRLSTLAEVMAAFPAARLQIALQDDSTVAAERLTNALVAAQAQDRVIVGSPHESVLRRFRRLSPDVATVAGGNELRTFSLLQGFGLIGLHRALGDVYEAPIKSGRLRLDSPRFIANVHALNQKIFFSGVDDPAEISRLLALGADGIITARPELAQDVFSK
jgi:glycerophosphoryl diester phosphodiesterase